MRNEFDIYSIFCVVEHRSIVRMSKNCAVSPSVTILITFNYSLTHWNNQNRLNRLLKSRMKHERFNLKFPLILMCSFNHKTSIHIFGTVNYDKYKHLRNRNCVFMQETALQTVASPITFVEVGSVYLKAKESPSIAVHPLLGDTCMWELQENMCISWPYVKWRFTVKVSAWIDYSTASA